MESHGLCGIKSRPELAEAIPAGTTSRIRIGQRGRRIVPRFAGFILSGGLLCVHGSATAEVIFKANFETGDLSEWTKTGTRNQNATPRNVQVVTDIVQEGKYAGK